MSYKETWQELYDELEELLGREPTWQEMDKAMDDHYSDLLEAYNNE